MKFSELWLREWVDPQLDTAALGAQLTLAGLELDGLEPAAAEFSGVIVAEIIAAERHPDADKLQVCSVNTGDETVQIVCGAKNARKGLKAALATVGAALPPAEAGGKPFKIKPAKLRGVPSQGMLCAAAELGLAEESAGLLELPSDAPVGTSLREYLDLEDQLIEIDLTPNRGDCLSILGIAREVAALNSLSLKQSADVAAVPATLDDSFPIDIAAPADCPRYVGRVLKGLNATAATPAWMVERLRRSGIRSLGPLVDVTNYVLLERGQPMHAFDLAKLEQGISVRRATAGEALVLLDESEIKLDDECLVIADANGPLALAGVMGGAASGCGDETQDILLESAFFTPITIAGRARRFGLHTDSSHRFERGVDPAGQVAAIERATALLLEICGGQAGPVLEHSDTAALPVNPAVQITPDRVARALGMPVAVDTIRDSLERLGMQVAGTDVELAVTAPSWRHDITIPADLIEEVARLIGYDNLPTSDATNVGQIRARSASTQRRELAADVLVERGYQEAITYSFVDPALQAMIAPQAEAITLANPIASDMAVMRDNLWCGLLQAMQYNLNRQQGRVRLFEQGLRFRLNEGELQQQPILAGVAIGPLLPEQWHSAATDVDFYDVKADLTALLAALGVQGQWVAAGDDLPTALHPGRSAQLLGRHGRMGWLGELHPAIASQLGLGKRAILFELELQHLNDEEAIKFNALSKFPAIRRDLAVVVAETVSAQALCEAVLEAIPSLLTEVFVFDVYRGEDLSTDNPEIKLKSVALGLILQDFSATLTDQRITEAMAAVRESLERRCAARLRGADD